MFDKGGSGTTLAAANMASVLGNSSSRLHKLGTDKQGPKPEPEVGRGRRGSCCRRAALPLPLPPLRRRRWARWQARS